MQLFGVDKNIFPLLKNGKFPRALVQIGNHTLEIAGFVESGKKLVRGSAQPKMANTLVAAGQVGEGCVMTPPEKNKPCYFGVYLGARSILLKTKTTEQNVPACNHCPCMHENLERDIGHISNKSMLRANVISPMIRT